MSTSQYFDLWRGIEEEAGEPTLPIALVEALSVEVFDAPIFAALCSPNLNVAVSRIGRFKRLIGPLALHQDHGDAATTIEIEFLDKTLEPPIPLIAAELAFFVQLARIATREHVEPIAVTTPVPPRPEAAYAAYFGRPVTVGAKHTVAFSARDAERPFLTLNEEMWEFFLPGLRKRLSELDETATTVDRVRGALLELLPSGESSLAAISRKLAVSTRTLQRKLYAEDRSYQSVLDEVREELARHYLGHSALSGAEISYLLGFEDPNSFHRAFHGWTGETPEQVRAGR